MKVKEVMTKDPRVCWPDTNLAAATEVMWNANCGIVPVVEDGGYVVGVLTDRDVCIAVGTRGRVASDIAVGDVISGNVFKCHPDTDIAEALETMRTQKVRRLPVVDAEGRIQGILSLDDIAVRAQPATAGKRPALSLDEVALTLKSIVGQQQPTEQQALQLAASD